MIDKEIVNKKGVPETLCSVVALCNIVSPVLLLLVMMVLGRVICWGISER